MRARARGFTLLEVLLALAIGAALLVIAFAGVRVALASWHRGEERAEAHQHARGVALTLARAVGGAYPYVGPRGEAPEGELLFAGAEGRLELVTQGAPFPFAIPIAFTAVVITLGEGEQAGLIVRQRALPNRQPFERAEVVFHDPTVTSLGFKFMDRSGSWLESWNGATEQTMPRAVRIELGVGGPGEPRKLPPITVPLRVGAE